MQLFHQRGARRCPQQRYGLSTLEVVMATGIGLPVFALLTFTGIYLCRIVYSVIGSMVGSPLM